MKNVVLLTGGVSPEHEVSLHSARNIYKALDKDKYRVTIIGIGRNGAWRHLSVDALMELERVEGHEGEALCLVPGEQPVFRYVSGRDKFPHVDVVFNIIHGPFGEDGTLQGLLQSLQIPFVGPDVLGSSVGMDKDFTKRLLRDAGIPVAPWRTLFYHEKPDGKEIIGALGLPLFVKPANMGSSVGVRRAENEAELLEAIQYAFRFDKKVIVEKAIKGREIETAILGNLEEVRVSGVGEIVMEKGFYDYDSKYLSPDAAKVVIPADDITEGALELIRSTAVNAYRALGLEGLTRMDVFLVDDQTVYVNEPNTLPGFTNISMYPKLWEASGISYTNLIDQLLDLAIRRKEREASLKRTRL